MQYAYFCVPPRSTWNRSYSRAFFSKVWPETSKIAAL